MANAELVVNALKDLSNKKELSRYDENVCLDIHKRLDAKLNEKNLSISEKSQFGRQNYHVMDKWSQVFPAGVSECLKEYFRHKAMWAPKFDPRFPNQNQVKNCFVNYVDFQRCLKLKGETHKDCEYFKLTAKALCPDQWYEKFEEQIESDSFPVNI